MKYIAKKPTEIMDIKHPIRLELFTVEVVKDVNDIEVTIPKSIGIYTLEQLQSERNRFQEMVDDLDSKIKLFETK
jgi:hypothetical protein